MGESAMRMLVADDEVDIANMLAEYFRMEGYDVTCANSGQKRSPRPLQAPPRYHAARREHAGHGRFRGVPPRAST